MPKEGEERTIEAELVFMFTEPDSSVGITGGWCLAGLNVGRKFLEIDQATVRNQGYLFVFEESATRELTKMEEEVSEEDPEA